MLTTISLLYYFYRDKTLFQFIAISFIGVLLYILAVDYCHIVAIANFQWYKVVQWTKLLGLVALVAVLREMMGKYDLKLNPILNQIAIGVSLVLMLLMGYFYREGKFKNGYKMWNEKEIALCKKVKNLTPIDATFIQPFEMMSFKFYAQRSSYIEFKAIAKNQRDIKEWYRRIQEVFGLDYQLDKAGFGL